MPPPLLPLLLFTFLLSSLAAAAQQPSLAAEIDALTAFKLSLQDPLSALSDWNSTSPSAPCDWRGVLCSNTHVTELRLPNLRLSGPLSPQLSLLTRLRRLSLHSNSLNGTIPLSLSALTSLRYLFLHSNSFSGPLPPSSLSNLTSLSALDLNSNSLSGPIPSSLPPNLRFLDLSSNAFSDAIPSTISSLPGLQLLNLSHNRLRGPVPPSVGEMQDLEYLSLDYNLALEGPLPAALANCTSLIHLSADGNSIAGVIPPAIPSLPRIQVLSLERNNLSGKVPGSATCGGGGSLRVVRLGFNGFTGIDDVGGGGGRRRCVGGLEELYLQQNRIGGEFSRLLANLASSSASASLSVLDVSGNSLTGAIPAEIGDFWKLKELRASNNSLTGTVPSELRKLSSTLQVLDLSGNRISGELPGFLGGMTELTTLSLGRNLLSGELGAAGVGNLSRLETLDLRENRLTGSLSDEVVAGLSGRLSVMELGGNGFVGERLPESIGGMKELVVLNLSGNGFAGGIPGSFGNLYRLNTLDLSKMRLSGELPSELSGLPNLETVALQENFLSGDVPEGFSSLLGLGYLNLSSNNFSGEIPSTFGFLKSLVVLSLANNSNISGSIPPELGNCSDLQVLELHSNRLSGEIPEELSQCTALTSILLEGNRLSGSIPSSLSKLSNLTALDLSSNALSGEIPANLTAGLSNLIYFNVSHNNLQGPIPAQLGSRFGDSSLYSGNRNLCGKPLDKECEDVNKESGRSRRRLIWLLAVAITGSFLLAVCCCVYIVGFLRWRKRLREGADGEKKPSPARASSGAGTGGGRSSGRGSSTESNGVGGPKLVMFNNKITLAETIEATRNFDEENVLSRTKHGLLFKASYNDGMVLAIRRLQDGSLDENLFKKEAEALGKIRHRNLTVLRGYYAGPPDLRLLVYDYMPNGNLATLLQEASHQDGHVLNWPMRHLIALGIARGLSFLHGSQMVHGDVKPQNVLFDADFEAHLSDFGLERLTVSTPAEPSTSTTATSTVGTLGYVSPEAAVTGEVAKESDVYSFGIVLLELLTGKRPLMFTQDEDIVKWVKRQLQRGQITELLEPGLLELDPESSEWEEFLLGIKVGLLCTAADAMDRPTMSDIVFMLEGCRVGPDIPSSADPTSQPSPA